ncbi:MAG: AAA family ATPase [Saprospiraceae bacterium]|nr:AAA family ATPase [Saprospiraceae bacterium]MBK7812714.1 AAA family ATPase [Saprospiraceae bacterium]MBK9630905.1 AAA family ATPase [Saprospiraceae bacterium]
MSIKKPVFLVGMPGSGKSTIGQSISSHFKLDFIDMDVLFEIKFGIGIQEYWDQRSELEFRILERKLLFELMFSTPAVIATGGGLPCWFNNMYWISQFDTLYLSVKPEELLENLQNQPRAIFKDGKADLAQLVDLYYKRNPFYKQAKHHITAKDIPTILNFFKLHFLI